MSPAGFDAARVYSRPVLEQATCETMTPDAMDWVLERGWRNFGCDFFRTSHAIHDSSVCGVMALRLDARQFLASESQRRVMRKNASLNVRIVPAQHGADYDAMFLKHRERFSDHLPNSLHSFLSENPATMPCETIALEARLNGQLAAVSFLALGAQSTSAIYAMFDPEYASRSLGIFTMLQEIAFTRSTGRTWYYPGYAYTMPSPYDYKLRFRGLEVFDWESRWAPLVRPIEWSYPWVEPNHSTTESATAAPDCQTASTRDSQTESPATKHPAGN